MVEKKTNSKSISRSSAAEYLTFIAATGDEGVDVIYADENIWLSQKMMGMLYDVNTRTVNEHLKHIFADNEVDENSVVRNFRITATDREILKNAGKVTAEIAKTHAETEFEKYRIVQDHLFESDFDRMLKKQLPNKEEQA
ncbi:MAG: hypothetical protein GZ091_18460 [Paludibacter sp.]|nr:hypothetical protein [Paludibacter sp.]